MFRSPTPDPSSYVASVLRFLELPSVPFPWAISLTPLLGIVPFFTAFFNDSSQIFPRFARVSHAGRCPVPSRFLRCFFLRVLPVRAASSIPPPLGFLIIAVPHRLPPLSPLPDDFLTSSSLILIPFKLPFLLTYFFSLASLSHLMGLEVSFQISFLVDFFDTPPVPAHQSSRTLTLFS